MADFSRRELLKTGAYLSLAGAGAAILDACESSSTAATTGGTAAGGAAPSSLKTAFTWFLAHPVTKGWSNGIKNLLDAQEKVQISYEVLDPNAHADVQVQQLNTLIDKNYNIIWVQPIDSAALAAPIKKARDAGIIVITINIQANAVHAAHVTQPHQKFSAEIGKRLVQSINGTGNVYLVTNAQGTSIYNARKNGVLSEISKAPGIKVLGEADGMADAKRAHDAFVPVLQGNPKIDAVWCLNEDMGLGVIQALKEANRTAVVWANGDGEAAAFDAIKAGTMAGTVSTDVVQQGSIAAAVALGYTAQGLKGNQIPNQAEIAVPFVIVDKTNVDKLPRPVF